MSKSNDLIHGELATLVKMIEVLCWEFEDTEPDYKFLVKSISIVIPRMTSLLEDLEDAKE